MIGVRRVEEGDAQVVGPAEGPLGLGEGQPDDGDGAESYLRQGNSRLPEGKVFHGRQLLLAGRFPAFHHRIADKSPDRKGGAIENAITPCLRAAGSVTGARLGRRRTLSSVTTAPETDILVGFSALALSPRGSSLRPWRGEFTLCPATLPLPK
ncbi:hypothetical protein SDC9_66053 [bioreactor metagenome]|uniref:Uncharacterized protein n=1 Tax=bioreactor metagenome TaxID=1076179 RepID=A0A644XUP6_9ZZZZ